MTPLIKLLKLEKLRQRIEGIDEAKPHALVIGDAMLDGYRQVNVQRVSPEDPFIPVANVIGFEYRLGGALNVAQGLAALGFRVTYAGIIGTGAYADPLRKSGSDLLIAEAKKKEIEMIVVKDPSRPTTLKIRTVGEYKKQGGMREDLEDASEFKPKVLEALNYRIRQCLARRYNYLVISDYAKGTIGTWTHELIADAQKEGTVVISAPKPKNNVHLLGSNVICVNLREAASIFFGKENDERALAEIDVLTKRLTEQNGVPGKYGIITCGRHGIRGYDKRKEESYRADTIAKDVIDVTGAGDTVLATITTGISLELELKNILELANLAAGIKVGLLGANAITLESIVERIRYHA